jgi:hypothetical protein
LSGKIDKLNTKIEIIQCLHSKTSTGVSPGFQIPRRGTEIPRKGTVNAASVMFWWKSIMNACPFPVLQPEGQNCFINHSGALRFELESAKLNDKKKYKIKFNQFLVVILFRILITLFLSKEHHAFIWT